MDFDSELELHTSDGNTGSALRLSRSATGAAQAGQARAAAWTRSLARLRSLFNCNIEVIRDDSAADSDTVTASAVTVTVP